MRVNYIDAGIRFLKTDIFPGTGKERKSKPYGLQGDEVLIIKAEASVCIVEAKRTLNRFPIDPAALSLEPVAIPPERLIKFTPLKKYKK